MELHTKKANPTPKIVNITPKLFNKKTTKFFLLVFFSPVYIEKRELQPNKRSKHQIKFYFKNAQKKIILFTKYLSFLKSNK